MTPYRTGLFILIILITIISAGCNTGEGNGNTGDIEMLTYSDEAISFEYPDWAEIASDEEEVFLLRSDGSNVFFASRYPVPSTLMMQEMEKNLGAVFDGEYCFYKLDSEGNKLNAISRIIHSDYQTYVITIASAGQPDKNLLSSVRSVRRTLTLKDGVGLMPIPANGDASLLPQACREARTLGAEVISWYFFWGDLADDWTVADCVMECLSYEGKSVAVMNIIHTNVLGKYPPEFNHFADPGFKEAFAEFSIEFVDRYKPEYYFIGGEVDIYLNAHRDEIPAFKEVYDYAYREIKKASPDTKVGTVFAYHYARDYGALDIIRTLAAESDVIGYTVHPYKGDFMYDDVSRGLEYLNEVGDVVPDKPYAILETCWSSSPLLGSSEDLQAEFVHDFFTYADSSDAEFVIWFSLHDQDDCSEAAATHLEPVPDLQIDEEYVKAFEEFMCSPGLKYSDGSPKKAWYIWKQYTQ